MPKQPWRPTSAERAGKFAVHVPEQFCEQTRKILYIGKATAGAFDGEDAAGRWFNNVDSAFWQFARKVSGLADPEASESLRNLAWSNIFKQGVAAGNPGHALAAEQWHTAIDALKDEAATLKPDLILLVNAGYYEEIPREAFDIPEIASDGRQLQERTVPDEQYSIWFRKPVGTLPAIVWMNHPQGKTTAYTNAALQVICDVTGW